MHEPDVTHAGSGCLFDHVYRVWTCNLELEPVVGLRSGVIVPMPQIVVGPEAAAAKQHKLVFREPAQYPLVDYLAVRIAVDYVLRLFDCELGEAVDRDVGK